MNELNWVYAVGEIDHEIVDEAKEEEHFSTETVSFPKKKKTGIKRVAIIFLAAIISVFGLLMLNENVRAAVTRSVISLIDNGIIVKFTGSNETGKSKNTSDVTFGYIPEGLTLNEMHDDEHPNHRYVNLEKTNDFFDPLVSIRVLPTNDVERGFSEPSWKNVYQSTVNGMDAFMIDVETVIDGKPFSSHGIIFGDEDITIDIVGINISHEELVKIAENINW